MTDHVQTLRSNLDKLVPKDRGFAQSLLDQFDRRGSLSPKQWPYVEQLAQRATAPAKPQLELVAIGDFQGMIGLFDKARQHLKHPSITIDTPEVGEIKLGVAGPRARQPGTINVVGKNRAASFVPSWDRQDEDVWYGRITLKGEWQPSPRDPVPATLVDFLKKFAADPAGTAASYGKLTGKCCFCNRPLKDHRSTEVGYGPVCADHFGLPWGE